MKLRTEELNTAEQLAEFDQWLTAKLDRIKNTDKFSNEINALCDCIIAISAHLGNFRDYQSCNVENLCMAVENVCDGLIVNDFFAKDERRVANFLDSFFNLLFLSTGATDNNLKNHFLIKLKADDVAPLLPKRGRSAKVIKFTLVNIPSTTKSSFISEKLASCFVGAHRHYIDKVSTEPVFDLLLYFKIILKEYVSLILEDEEDSHQLWAIGRSFMNLSEEHGNRSFGKYLLNSCTIFKVRGSVSASGGHITEDILRQKLSSIGLRADVDFNTNDVTIGEEEIVENGKRKKKTRAYDFILPYQIENWEPKPKLFIQAQFYAGDSGSVSHKVVDQTISSRIYTLNQYPNARFVEYLDGAGYYASLRGDLEHMLTYDNTASFFQVKSILLRLRRELQHIEFLTPIEFEHAILVSDTASTEAIFTALLDEGYPQEEIERAKSICISQQFVNEEEGKLSISESRIDIARRLLILDVAANHSYKLTEAQRISQKYILVPGFGENVGLLDSELTKLLDDICKQLKITTAEYSADIEWLLDEGVIKRR
jgi:hypothetical protein